MKFRILNTETGRFENNLHLDCNGNVCVSQGGDCRIDHSDKYEIQLSTNRFDKYDNEIFVGDKLEITIFDCLDNDTQHKVEVKHEDCGIFLHSETDEWFEAGWAIDQDCEVELIR